jgi:hypothetical protein
MVATMEKLEKWLGDIVRSNLLYYFEVEVTVLSVKLRLLVSGRPKLCEAQRRRFPCEVASCRELWLTIPRWSFRGIGKLLVRTS